MIQYNYPTTILLGEDSLKEFSLRLKTKKHKKILVVSDKTLEKAGLIKKVTDELEVSKINYAVFSDARPNPVEEDVENGVNAFKKNKCDSLIALGGGSPMDVAKVIKIMVAHKPPLKQYDDCLGGDRLITNPMPPLYAIPTTAGTGSEVGRSGVIIMKETGRKTIFFHPSLLPSIAVLDPKMTEGLPPDITAATGMDAFVHCLEAYFAPMFHPMADGIALQGMELVLKYLPRAYKNGKDLDAREKMLIAASMGATAFQKGLGMIHSMAHPLSSMFHLHHGLANALMLPESIAFIENSNLTDDQRRRIDKVQSIFAELNIKKESLSKSLRDFCESVGIKSGLSGSGINESDLEDLSREAFQDPCHSGNLFPVTQEDLLSVYRKAL